MVSLTGLLRVPESVNVNALPRPRLRRNERTNRETEKETQRGKIKWHSTVYRARPSRPSSTLLFISEDNIAVPSSINNTYTTYISWVMPNVAAVSVAVSRYNASYTFVLYPATCENSNTSCGALSSRTFKKKNKKTLKFKLLSNKYLFANRDTYISYTHERRTKIARIISLR